MIVRSWCGRVFAGLLLLLAGACHVAAEPKPPVSGTAGVELYRLKAPGGSGTIDQGSDLHFGSLDARKGLWIVCDRNGGKSAGRIYFVEEETLRRSRGSGVVVADEEFTIVPPADWTALARSSAGVSEEILAELRRRLTPDLERSGEPFLDLEAVTVAPSLTPPHPPRLFVVSEEPHSLVLELALDLRKGSGRAELISVHFYPELDDEHGTDLNDGIEGLAWAGRPGEFFFAEEGTRDARVPPSPRLFFLDPRLGLARLDSGRLRPWEEPSEKMTRAVHGLRVGQSQTLNAVTMMEDGRLLAVDRNGGAILRIDPKAGTAERFLNFIDPEGLNLRALLAEFPASRRMPYVSIEGIALDGEGAIWLIDDPAMPEAFRESCLIRLSLPQSPATASAPRN